MSQASPLRITRLDYTESTLPGGVVRVEAVVQNTARQPRRARLELYDAAGNAIAVVEETLGANASDTVSLAFRAPAAPGSYTYTLRLVDVQAGATADEETFAVTVVPTPETLGRSGGSNWGQALILALALLALIGGLAGASAIRRG